MPHPVAGRTGQGEACRVAGAQGLDLQRGQDPDSPRRALRVRLPGIQRPPLPRQATDQTIQGSHPANPGTAPNGDPRLAWIQRAGGHLRAQPIVKGWAAYYRGVVSKKTFSVLDDYLWALTYKWATYSHPNKSKWWVSARYFGKFNKFRNNRWVFGDAASGAHLARFAWTDIVRHIMVKGGASPDDPALTEYWAK